MPDVRAFRGYRYDLGRVGVLSDVVAPPYDVIDPALQEALYQKHPHNVIRLDLNRAEPADDERRNRYTRAGRLLKDWLHDGILREETQPAVYVYHQVFTVDDQHYTRRGVLALARLEKFGAGRIFPHEETMSGPKEDRFRLMQATAMNLSPIFGLYPDPANDVQTMLEEAVRRALPLEAVDHLGTISRLWPLSDSGVIHRLRSSLTNQPVFIADGHHRYETALRYLDERRATGDVRDDEHPANFTLMMLVGMNDPGLLILPTHRLLSGLPAVSSSQLCEILGTHFDITRIGQGAVAARETWALIEANGEQLFLGFGTVADDTWHTARLRSTAAMDQLAAQHCPAWRGLGVSILHELVIAHLLRSALRIELVCKYVHRLDEVLSDVENQRCQIAALVPPATMHHVESIASNHEKMPPKSTYFYPKLLTGLVFNPLR